MTNHCSKDWTKSIILKEEACKPSHHLTVHFLNTIHNQTNSLVRDSITYGFSTKGVCFCDKTVGISGPASLGSDVAVMYREAKRKREARSINLQLYFWDWLKATKNLGNHWVLWGIHLHIVHFCLMCLKVWDCEWRDPTAQSKAKLNWCECHMWRETPFALFSLPSSSALFMILYHVNVKICLWYPQICPGLPKDCINVKNPSSTYSCLLLHLSSFWGDSPSNSYNVLQKAHYASWSFIEHSIWAWALSCGALIHVCPLLVSKSLQFKVFLLIEQDHCLWLWLLTISTIFLNVFVTSLWNCAVRIRAMCPSWCSWS